jgi:hypothetical protein
MPEISHVRMAVPDEGVLNRVLREGGAQLFPQWLYAEPGREPRILWWGLRGAMVELEVTPESSGLLPRPVDDWTDAPRALVLATVDADRASSDLAAAIGPMQWLDTGVDEQLGARCRRAPVGRSVIVLAEAATEGYVAACLAQFGEGPVAVALDGASPAGRRMARNPVSGEPATYVRIGPATAPTLIFLSPQ